MEQARSLPDQNTREAEFAAGLNAYLDAVRGERAAIDEITHLRTQLMERDAEIGTLRRLADKQQKHLVAVSKALGAANVHIQNIKNAYTGQAAMTQEAISTERALETNDADDADKMAARFAPAGLTQGRALPPNIAQMPMRATRADRIAAE
jgi:DNA-binding protein H-NS